MSRSERPDARIAQAVPTDEIRAFRRRILSWYRRAGRDFPWRASDAEPYARVVAEVLLQRTRAETVAAFYSRFFAKFPDWGALAQATTGQLRTFLKPIGLWRRRASSLRRLALEVIRLGGELPQSRADLEKLPAVGQYVASAALLFYHAQPEPLLDSGMARVIERHFGPRTLADIRFDPYLQQLSRRLVRGQTAADMNWAVLDLAALVCKPTTPACDICPVEMSCSFRSAARQAGANVVPLDDRAERVAAPRAFASPRGRLAGSAQTRVARRRAPRSGGAQSTEHGVVGAAKAKHGGRR